MNNEKVNQARKKITDEALSMGGDLANFIEEAVNRHVVDDEAAAKVLEKSLQDCVKEITAEARKRAFKGIAYLSHEDVERIALTYYGISNEKEGQIVNILDFI